MRRPTRSLLPGNARGFTLIEVLVSLIIIAVGMLGIAKLQGLALSNTGIASMRSIAAIEATSLAAAMHSNRAFWSVSSTPSWYFVNDNSTGANSFSATPGGGGGTLALGASTDCQDAVCSTLTVAGYDVYMWIQSLNNALPHSKETVTCYNTSPQPVGCTIQVEWTENLVSANAQETQVAAGSAIVHPTYELYVVP